MNYKMIQFQKTGLIMTLEFGILMSKGTLIQNKLSKIAIPSLLIRPELSCCRNSQIEKLKNNYLNFSIDEIADSTHMVIFENPENISNLILKYKMKKIFTFLIITIFVVPETLIKNYYQIYLYLLNIVKIIILKKF